MQVHNLLLSRLMALFEEFFVLPFNSLLIAQILLLNIRCAHDVCTRTYSSGGEGGGECTFAIGVCSRQKDTRTDRHPHCPARGNKTKALAFTSWDDSWYKSGLYLTRSV